MITKNELREMIKNVWDSQPLEVDYDGSAIYSIKIDYIDGDKMDYSECLKLPTDGYEDVLDLEESKEYFKMLDEMTELIHQYIVNENIETFKLS